MPIYEFQCDACGAEFETLRAISDTSAAACPHCGAAHTRKLVSRSSFVLKGTGWYKTDYAAKAGADKAKDPSPSPKSEGSEGSKSEGSKSEKGAADSAAGGGDAAPAAPASSPKSGGATDAA